jgi:hypothetical protein
MNFSCLSPPLPRAEPTFPLFFHTLLADVAQTPSASIQATASFVIIPSSTFKSAYSQQTVTAKFLVCACCFFSAYADLIQPCESFSRTSIGNQAFGSKRQFLGSLSSLCENSLARRWTLCNGFELILPSTVIIWFSQRTARTSLTCFVSRERKTIEGGVKYS